MLVTLASSNVLLAEESVKNAHKDNGTGNTVSHADATGHANGNTSSAVKAKADTGSQQKNTNDALTFRQMQARHRQMQEAQLATFKRYLQERRQQSIAFNKSQRKAYIELMNARRTLMKKMMEQHHQAAEQRRNTMRLKMHQTSTTPASITAERENKA